MKRRMPGIMFLALALSLGFAAGCSKNANTGNSNNTAGGTANENKTTPTTADGGGATTEAAGSPTAALKAYYDAANRKDIEAAKKYLSQGTLRLIEESAKPRGKSVDEVLKEGAAQSPQVNAEFSNEEIKGNVATVDAKANGEMIKMFMVKEGGEWKLALDKTIENKLGQPIPKGPTGTDTDDEHGGHEEK